MKSYLFIHLFVILSVYTSKVMYSTHYSFFTLLDKMVIYMSMQEFAWVFETMHVWARVSVCVY